MIVSRGTTQGIEPVIECKVFIDPEPPLQRSSFGSPNCQCTTSELTEADGRSYTIPLAFGDTDEFASETTDSNRFLQLNPFDDLPSPLPAAKLVIRTIHLRRKDSYLMYF